MGTDDEKQELMEKYGCSAEQRETVVQYSLSPINSEQISDYSAVADSGIVCTTIIVLYHAMSCI